MCEVYQSPRASFRPEDSRHLEPTFKGSAFADCDPGLAKHARRSSVCSACCVRTAPCAAPPHTSPSAALLYLLESRFQESPFVRPSSCSFEFTFHVSFPEKEKRVRGLRGLCSKSISRRAQRRVMQSTALSASLQPSTSEQRVYGCADSSATQRSRELSPTGWQGVNARERSSFRLFVVTPGSASPELHPFPCPPKGLRTLVPRTSELLPPVLAERRQRAELGAEGARREARKAVRAATSSCPRPRRCAARPFPRREGSRAATVAGRWCARRRPGEESGNERVAEARGGPPAPHTALLRSALSAWRAVLQEP